MGSKAAHDRLTGVLAGVHDQLADIATKHKKQAALRLSAQAGDGTIEAMVNGRGQLIDIIIDKSFLDDHDFVELAGHITEAARAAARDASRRVAEMRAPINKRHKRVRR